MLSLRVVCGTTPPLHYASIPSPTAGYGPLSGVKPLNAAKIPRAFKRHAESAPLQSYDIGEAQLSPGQKPTNRKEADKLPPAKENGINASHNRPVFGESLFMELLPA